MSQSRLTYLFDRFIQKKITSAEKAELFELIANADADDELKVRLDELIQDTDAEMHLSENSADKILHAILGREPIQEEKISFQKKQIIPVWLRVAAASIILIGLVTYFIFYGGQGRKDDVIAKNKTTESSLISATTLVGEGKKIVLPDSTEVWLSPSSSIQYPSVFNGASREVRLSGEAFFEVAHDAKHPFIIYSGNIETKVLGTSFNIQAYDNQEEINVTVVTGKVNVTNKVKAENVDLIANERAVFYRKTTVLVKEETDTVSAPIMLKRKKWEVAYQGERLQKVAEDLHEYFGIKIEVADAIKECPVSFNVYLTDKQNKVEEILEPIAISINGSLQKKADVFLIDGKACPKK